MSETGQSLLLPFYFIQEFRFISSDQIARLVNGLDKLASTSSQVAGLKETLAVQEVVVKEKNDAADDLIQVN